MGDVIFFLAAMAMVAAGLVGVSDGVEEHKPGTTALGGFFALIGFVLIFAIGVSNGAGHPRSLSDLSSGIYKVQGEINTGGWRALWLTPLDSDSGKLYDLPRESASTNFGRYVQKEDGKLVPFKFEK